MVSGVKLITNLLRNGIIPLIFRNGIFIYSRNAVGISMTERKYTRWKKCLLCDDFVKLMFPEDAKDMLIVYEPVEGMSNESKNWKKRQLGYIHRACLDKAGSAVKK